MSLATCRLNRDQVVYRYSRVDLLRVFSRFRTSGTAEVNAQQCANCNMWTGVSTTDDKQQSTARERVRKNIAEVIKNPILVGVGGP